MSSRYKDFTITVEGGAGRYTVDASGPGGINIDPIPCHLTLDEAFIGDVERVKWGVQPAGGSLDDLMVRILENRLWLTDGSSPQPVAVPALTPTE